MISPFNFPAMVPLWFVPIAIACGNAVVLKPSREGPDRVDAAWRQWFAEAGLPDGVLNVVHGDKEAVDALLDHPDVRGGLVRRLHPDRALRLRDAAPAHGKRVQALGGAKNHMVVLPDADLDLAADAAVNAGFGSAGERCMAISVVVAVEPIGDELVDKIARADGRHPHRRRRAAAATWARWSPARTATGSRPMWTPECAAGATLVVDGRDVEPDGDGDGFWLGPTLFDHVTPEMSIYTDEIFGPVLSRGAGRLVRRGAGAGQRQPVRQRHGDLHQRRRRRPALPARGRGRHGRRQRADPGADGVLLLRRLEGRRCSATRTRTAPDGVHFFTRGKVVTSRWLDPSHGGVNLGFPTQT